MFRAIAVALAIGAFATSAPIQQLGHGTAGASAPHPSRTAASPTNGAATAAVTGAVAGAATGTARAAAAKKNSSGLPWASGASGTSVENGSFAQWRQRPLDIIGTWDDNNTAMVKDWQLQPNGTLAHWNGDLDIAIGAIGWGESWQQASQGAYDKRWRQALTELKRLRSSATGTTYIRFAHEMNGNWYPWGVNASSTPAFIAAWHRFRAMQQQIFPASKLVFSVTSQSQNGMDWRRTFPGAGQVDVFSVDYYNQYPLVTTKVQWAKQLTATDPFGAPEGLQGFRQFARAKGLPLSVSEWSNNSSMGDSPVFVQSMFDFFSQYAGSGAGQLLYEIQFDVESSGSGQWAIYPATLMRRSASTYAKLF